MVTLNHHAAVLKRILEKSYETVDYTCRWDDTEDDGWKKKVEKCKYSGRETNVKKLE